MLQKLFKNSKNQQLIKNQKNLATLIKKPLWVLKI